MISGLASVLGKCQLRLKNRRSSDIINFTCMLILYSLSRKNLMEFFKNCILDISWKYPGSWLGGICRQPAWTEAFSDQLATSDFLRF